MNLEDEIKDKLDFKKCTKIQGLSGGGCISSGDAYEVDDGERIFVKKSNRINSGEMFEGEMFSLKRIQETKTVRVPDPFCVVEDPADRDKDSPTHGLVMEYMEMKSLDKHQAKLGEDLAKLHLHNIELKKQYDYDSGFVGKHKNNDVKLIDSFGFDCVTNCGHIALDNDWHEDWVSFFARNRLDVQIKMVESRTVDELWSVLQLKIPKIFKEFKEREIKIEPSLLHGDLWSGNVAETEDEPVIFDPASFYGHSEFDLAIAEMFGGFRSTFYNSYFKSVKKVPGMEPRMDLYQLFHYLNHWNHFGSGYSAKCIALMKKLNKIQ